VTDGTPFWVVDGTALKAFEYTLSGSPLGSWAIDPAGAHPTGITINPSNVSDVWIVDSGTDKVYQYLGAAGRASGSQSASATFALAAGDSNPQGSADPPTADTLLTPAAAQRQLPFKESLTVVSVSPTGVVHYEGNATYFGHVTVVLYPDSTFTKTAANGDTASGYVTHATATTGTITLTGGTVRFQGVTGTSDYVISVDPNTGVTSVEITGTIAFSPSGQAVGPAGALAAPAAGSRVVPFKVSGGGTVPDGIPVFPGGTAPHNATGTATYLGRYTGEGTFTLLTFNPEMLNGTFTGSFVFVAANGDRLAFDYGATTPGTFTVTPTGDGKGVAQFVAVFTPDPAASTGRFADVTGGSFTMVATTEPFVLQPNELGYTAPFAYTWVGDGWLEFGKRQ
jgi:hypothetical protein